MSRNSTKTLDTKIPYYSCQARVLARIPEYNTQNIWDDIEYVTWTNGFGTPKYLLTKNE